jgi:hypothetical protein
MIRICERDATEIGDDAPARHDDAWQQPLAQRAKDEQIAAEEDDEQPQCHRVRIPPRQHCRSHAVAAFSPHTFYAMLKHSTVAWPQQIRGEMRHAAQYDNGCHEKAAMLVLSRLQHLWHSAVSE